MFKSLFAIGIGITVGGLALMALGDLKDYPSPIIASLNAVAWSLNHAFDWHLRVSTPERVGGEILTIGCLVMLIGWFRKTPA